MEQVIFSKLSRERLPQFQIETRIILLGNGEKAVEKVALNPAGMKHLSSIPYKSKVMEKMYGDELRVVPTTLTPEGAVRMPFQSGVRLGEKIDELIASDRLTDATELIKRLNNDILFPGTVPFTETEEFEEVFGKHELPSNLEAVSPANIDLIFDNILVDAAGDFYVVDCEWLFEFPVPVSYIVFRSLFFHSGFMSLPEVIREDLWQSFGIDKHSRDVYFRMELAFQNYVSGSGRKLQDYYAQSGKLCYSMATIEQVLKQNNDTNKRAESYFKAYETERDARVAYEKRASEYQSAYEIERKSRESYEKQASAYRKAYETESAAHQEAKKQADEFRAAYEVEQKARKAFEKQASDYRSAYETESAAHQEAKKQADEFRTAYEIEQKSREAYEQQAAEYRLAYEMEQSLKDVVQQEYDDYLHRTKKIAFGLYFHKEK